MLPVEKLTHVESMRYGVILVKLVEEECIVMIVHEVDLSVLVLPILHIMQNIVGDGHLRNENLRGLSHHEHREIVASFILSFHVPKDSAERLLVLLVHNSFDGITRAVYSVNLVKHINNIFLRVKIRNWYHSNSRLLQELNVSFWDV